MHDVGTCSVPDCDTAVLATGLCRKHYYRRYRNGTTDLQPKRGHKPCSVGGCEVAEKSRGLCNRHYQQWRTHGGTRTHLPFIEKFWTRVERGEDDQCWRWTGGGSNGYGYIRRDGAQVRVHRVAYEMTFGPVPEGKEIDHLCHEPKTCPGGSTCPHRRCVNPRHLAARTHEENCAGDRTVLGFQRHQRRKTHCPHGHPYDEENTYITSQGHRLCRTCNRNNSRARRTR